MKAPKPKIVVHWFRRDLRLEDNHSLYRALASGSPVLPIFIFDPQILTKLPGKDPRVEFILERLHRINLELAETYQSSLHVIHESPLEAFRKLTDQFDIIGVYTNEDYEPYARERDQLISELLQKQGIAFHQFKDQVIFAKDEVVKEDGLPYVVYTPYMKKWKSVFQNKKTTPFPSPSPAANFYKEASPPALPLLRELGFEPGDIRVPDFQIHDHLIQDYKDLRNLPAVPGTSRLGPHLRFGTVGIRTLVQRLAHFKDETFLNELIWREFFMQILWHFPYTVKQSFKPAYDRIEWRNREDEFEKWCKGQTGFPLVDAGMRELNRTGFMHNRVRMLTGSFLCKHLLIDWRWGEAYFAEKLLDFELSSNVGNWQWVAGCGVDAAPYFRIFNPSTQISKFDPKAVYIRQWVEEFDSPQYPLPMVDHKTARERCLSTYKKALQ